MHIDGFELMDKLGEGGMATVWKARQLSLDRAVAIKVLASRFAADPDDVARFQREAQSAAKLKHPGIVQVYDAAMHEGFYYFVMELIDGYTGGEWMSRSGRLSEKDALQVAECVAEALGHAWEKEGIIHCDIKPDNIMIDADGTVKIADLGLARTLSVMSGSKAEQTDDILGTPAFMSPEQARGDMHLDCRSDIYSLGATLYYLVTGKYLFEGHAQEDVIELQITGTADSPAELNPRLSRPVGMLIEAMLAKDPADRPKDWNTVRADLRLVRRRMAPQCKLSPGCASTVPPAVAQPSMAASRLTTAPELTTSVPWLKLVIAAGAVILVIIIITRMSGPGHAPTPSPVAATPPSRVAEPKPAPPAVDDTAFRDMFALAKQWASENPDRYDDAIQQFRDVARQARGTRFAGLANDEIARLEAARNEAADAVMATLEQDVAGLLATHRYQEAAGRYRDYAGMLADETQDRRQQAVERLEGMQREQEQAVAKRQAEAERRAGEAWLSVSQALLTQGCVPALSVMDGYLAEALPEAHQQALQAAREEIVAAAGVDARILKSFESAVGQDVTLDLTSGRVQLRLVTVTSEGVRGVESRRMGSGVIRVPVRFGVADLTVQEKLARMGSDSDPGVPLVKGLLAYQSNALDHARNFFAAVPAPLDEHLLAAMDTEREAERERRKKAQEEANALAEAEAMKAGIPAADVPAEPPVEDVVDRVRERDLIRLYEPGPFRALFQDIVRSNPMVADYEVEAYVDAENRLRRLDVTSAGLKSLEPIGDLKDLCILYLGAVPFRQRHRDYQTAPVSDLAPLAPLRLETLYIGQTAIQDLSPLAGMPLRELYAGGTQVEDVTPLRGMPLETLDVQRTPVRDLSPLKDLPLRVLNVSGASKFHEFRWLQGMALQELDASSTQLRDIGMLAGMPLERLNLSGTRVHDFRVLASLPLTHLDVSSTQIRDVTLLRGQQLESLNLRDSKVSSIESLRGMPLKSLTLAGTAVRDFSPLEALPLTDLDIAGCRVDSLSWAAGLPLRSLNLAQTGISDLSPLRGKELNYLNISDTKIRDLDELKFISVRHLSLRGMKVDLTPLAGMKLERLDLDDPERLLSALRAIRGLERINGMTFPELLENLRAGRRR